MCHYLSAVSAAVKSSVGVLVAMVTSIISSPLGVGVLLTR